MTNPITRVRRLRYLVAGIRIWWAIEGARMDNHDHLKGIAKQDIDLQKSKKKKVHPKPGPKRKGDRKDPRGSRPIVRNY